MLAAGFLPRVAVRSGDVVGSKIAKNWAAVYGESTKQSIQRRSLVTTHGDCSDGETACQGSELLTCRALSFNAF